MNQVKFYQLIKRYLPVDRQPYKNWLGHAIIAYTIVENRLKYGDLHFFQSVSLEIATDCNRRCSYCPHSTTKDISGRLDGTKMSERVFSVALQRLTEIKWTGIVSYHWYNEPMMDVPRLRDMVWRTKNMLPKCKPRIYTNGDYLTVESVRSLIEVGVVNFSVSDHQKERGSWHKKVEPVMAQFPGFFTVGRLWHDFKLNNRGGLVPVPEEKFDRRPTCNCPESCFTIDYLGNVYLCGTDYMRKHCYGNIQKESIIQIWNDLEFAKVRDELRRGIIRYELCKKCCGVA